MPKMCFKSTTATDQVSFKWEIMSQFTSPEPGNGSQCTETEDTYKASALVFQTGSMDSIEQIPGYTVELKYSVSMLKVKRVGKLFKIRILSSFTILLENNT